MSHNRSIQVPVAFVLLATTALVITNPVAAANATIQRAAPITRPADLSSNATVWATGLDNPRGLKFGPDGALYVAEGGTGGANSAVGKCDQVPAPVGPYTGGKNGARIS